MNLTFITQTSPQAYATHLHAELQKRAKSTDARLRDPAAIINLYERAISDEAKRKSAALRAVASIGEPAEKGARAGGKGGMEGKGGKEGEDEGVRNSEAWLSEFWTGYLSFLVCLSLSLYIQLMRSELT